MENWVWGASFLNNKNGDVEVRTHVQINLPLVTFHDALRYLATTVEVKYISRPTLKEIFIVVCAGWSGSYEMVFIAQEDTRSRSRF